MADPSLIEALMNRPLAARGAFNAHKRAALAWALREEPLKIQVMKPIMLPRSIMSQSTKRRNPERRQNPEDAESDEPAPLQRDEEQFERIIRFKPTIRGSSRNAIIAHPAVAPAAPMKDAWQIPPNPVEA